MCRRQISLMGIALGVGGAAGEMSWATGRYEPRLFEGRTVEVGDRESRIHARSSTTVSLARARSDTTRRVDPRPGVRPPNRHAALETDSYWIFHQ